MKINGPYGFIAMKSNGGYPLYSIVDRDDNEVVLVSDEDTAELLTAGLTALFEKEKN